MVLGQFQLVDISKDSQVVVESPTFYEALAEPLDMSMFVDRVAKLSQVSGLSSVLLSPNRVCEDYAYDTLDVFPIFQMSLEAEGYFPVTCGGLVSVAGPLDFNSG